MVRKEFLEEARKTRRREEWQQRKRQYQPGVATFKMDNPRGEVLFHKSQVSTQVRLSHNKQQPFFFALLSDMLRL